MSAPRPKARASSPPPQPRVGPTGLHLGAETLPLWSGAVHYFRLDPVHWRPALESVKQMGLDVVETYVPWGVHETGHGSFDFGQEDPSLDLGAFLTLVGSLGLRCIIRPGPHINAELTYFGLPRRVVDDPRCQARSPDGGVVPFVAPPRMFAVPSYASRQFRKETLTWFEAACAQIKPHLWPAGPVVMLQVDNEAAYYFRDSPFDQDYHDDARADFRDFLKQRYGTLAGLNAAHQAEHRSWAMVQPPERFEANHLPALNRQLDWVAFQEQLLCAALGHWGRQLRELLGRQIPLLHNLPMGDRALATGLASVGREVDLVAFDYYHGRTSHAVVRDRTARLAGSGTLPFAAELGVGAPPFFGSRPHHDAMTTTLFALAYGLRGFNLYMAVDRDRWYGAPIDDRGRPRQGAYRWRQLLQALGDLEFHRLQRDVRVALVIPREYARLSRAAHGLGPLTPTLLDLAGVAPGDSSIAIPALEAEDPRHWGRLLGWLAESLDRSNVPFVFVDSDGELPAGIDVVFSPSYGFAGEQHWQALRKHAQAGLLTLVGPGWPQLGDRLEQHVFDRSGLSLLPVATQAQVEAAVLELLDGPVSADGFGCEEPSVRTTVHRDSSGPRVVFVMQTMPGFVDANLALPEPMCLCDVLTSERYRGESHVSIPMTGYSCRMLRVEPLTT